MLRTLDLLMSTSSGTFADSVGDRFPLSCGRRSPKMLGHIAKLATDCRQS